MKASIAMESPVSKDEIIELLLLILKEEREKRKEAQTNLENTKIVLDEMYALQRQRGYRFHQGRLECDGGVDEVD